MFKKQATAASLSLFASALVLISAAAPAHAGPVTPTELMAILKNAKIINQSALMRAALTDQEALVTAKRSAKDTDNDCKINAVMFAKTLMDAYPEQVLRVKVMFFDFEKSRYSQIVIRKGDVAAFRSGSLSKDALLGSLEITNVADPTMNAAATQSGSGSASGAGVVAGPFQDKRLLLLSHIEALSQKGTNVKAFRAIFDQIEDLARQGNETALNQKIPYLFEKLQEQQKLVKQASQVGKSTTTAVQSSSSNSSSPNAGAAAGQPTAADNLNASKLISRRLFLEGAINQAPDDNKKNSYKQRVAHIDSLIEEHKWKDADKELATMEKELDVKHPFGFH
ncbi:MAG: hypothetical protein IT343_12730 [Candidatus Melainabacteria bacterium]|jgi:hypothetical protein|nr:hypothetical protein [Candidatus Melainabacteria bacterium]